MKTAVSKGKQADQIYLHINFEIVKEIKILLKYFEILKK